MSNNNQFIHAFFYELQAIEGQPAQRRMITQEQLQYIYDQGVKQGRKEKKVRKK